MRRAGGRSGPVTREVRRCPPSLGTAGGPRPGGRAGPARRGHGARRVHTRAHSPRACSVRPWELPAESPAPRPPPRPPLAKLGAARSRVGGAAPACRPSASRSPHPLGPAPGASLSRRPAAGNRRGCHTPVAGRGRRPGGRRPGGSVGPPAGWTRSWGARRAHGRGAGSSLGGRGRERGPGAHGAVTHKASGSSLPRRRGKSAARTRPAAFGAPAGCEVPGGCHCKATPMVFRGAGGQVWDPGLRALPARPGPGQARCLRLALAAPLGTDGHLGGCEVAEEKAEVWVGIRWDGSTALENT